MNHIPEIKIGIVAVSRDCFPESLSVSRRKSLIDAYTKKYGHKDIYDCLLYTSPGQGRSRMRRGRTDDRGS